MAVVTAISADGSLVGGYEASSEQAVVWNGEGQIEGKGPGRIFDINGNGTVFVGDTGGSGFPAVWNNGNNAVKILDSDELGQSMSVAANGQLSCGYVFPAGEDLTAKKFIHASQTMVAVEPAYSRATRITPDGNVVVGEAASGAFRQIGNGPMEYFGSGSVNLLDVSDDGKIVVGSNSSNQLFRWTKEAGFRNLGYLHNGGYDDRDASITGDGRNIIGGGGAAGLDVFVWDETNLLRDVTPLLEAAGLDLSGWDLNRISAVSYDGDVVAGYGYHDVEGVVETDSWMIKGFSKILYPTIRIDKEGSDYVLVFSGVLQESDDLGIADPWEDVAGDPTHKYVVDQPLAAKKFFRARSL